LVNSLPQISIVVTAYNNAETIAECVRSLAYQDYPNTRITVVCDLSSSDNTISRVEALRATTENLDIVHCSRVGRSEARNIGFRKTNGEIVMFADGDDVYEPDYMSKAASALALDSNAGGVCLGGAPLVGSGTFLERYYEAFGATDERFDPNSGTGPEWAWVYTRRCLERVKGFDERLAQAEDKDLCRRVKAASFTVLYVPGVNWHHRKPRNLAEYVNKEYSGGMRRILSDMKNHEYFSVIFAIAPVSYLVLLGILVAVVGFLYPLLILVGSVAGYLILFRRKRAKIRRHIDLVGFAFLALVGRIAFSLGSLLGLGVLTLHGVDEPRVNSHPA
jgi:glycosyltransferase involved in cell wall biosynthesis